MAAAAAAPSDGDGRTAYTVLRGFRIPRNLIEPDAEGDIMAFIPITERTTDGSTAARAQAFEDLKVDEAVLASTPSRSWVVKKRRWDKRQVEEED